MLLKNYKLSKYTDLISGPTWKVSLLPLFITCVALYLLIRKRRSSILKTKPRTALAELNAHTPDTAAKSRRVSFSKRTGVAEFVVNEATTTWRNFYEEQNRTLESSGNESELHRAASNPTISQQFQEMEAEIACTTLGNPTKKANVTMFSDMNFTEELANLDRMAMDKSINAPTRHFEMSVITDKSKVFSDSFQAPMLVEEADVLEVNFSTMQPIRAPGKEEHDDLSDIVKDVERCNSKVGQSFLKDFNKSCYVEVDLNETKGAVGYDISDMSITDTISNPKVLATASRDKPKQTIDWTADKENILNEPYPQIIASARVEEENVLIFDGKKLKVANINDKVDDILNNVPERFDKTRFNSKTLQLADNVGRDVGLSMTDLSKFNITVSQDDKDELTMKNISHQMSLMPDVSLVSTGIDNPSVSIANKLSRSNITNKSYNISETNTLGLPVTGDFMVNGTNINISKDNNEKSTEHYAESQSNVKLKEVSKRKTIVLNQDDDLPNFTDVVPPQFDQSVLKGFQKGAVVFDTEDSVASVSFTRAYLQQIQDSGIFEKCERKHVDVTDNRVSIMDTFVKQGLPIESIEGSAHKLTTGIFEKVNEVKRKKIASDNDNVNMSIIRNIPQDIEEATKTSTERMIQEFDTKKRQTMVLENENVNMSITLAIPQNIEETSETLIGGIDSQVNEKTKGQTIVFGSDEDNANMSITQAIPQVIEKAGKTLMERIYPQVVDAKKRQTIVFENENANMSITLAIPQVTVEPGKTPFGEIDQQINEKTNIFEGCDDNANMSITLALPQVTVQAGKTTIGGIGQQINEKTKIFEHCEDSANMSITQAIPQVIGEATKTMTDRVIQQVVDAKKRQTIVFENENANMSITLALPQIIDETRKSLVERIGQQINKTKRQTIVVENGEDNANVSITQTIPQVIEVAGKMSTEDSITEVTDATKRQTMVFGNENGNMSITLAIPQLIEETGKTVIGETNQQVNEETKMQTIVFESNEDNANMSITQALRQVNEEACKNVTECIAKEVVDAKKRQTIVFENENANMSITFSITKAEKESELLMKGVDQQTNEETKRQTIVFEGDDDNANMSIIQTFPKIIDEKNKIRQTLLITEDNSLDNLSITQIVPSKLPKVTNKHETIVFENDGCNMSITQALPTVASLKKEINMFDKNNDLPDAFTVQSVPMKLNIGNGENTTVFDNQHSHCNISNTQTIPPSVPQRHQRLFHKEVDLGNLSMTQIVPTKLTAKESETNNILEVCEGNISKTQEIPLKSPVAVQKQNTNDNDNILMVPKVKVSNNDEKSNISDMSQLSPSKDEFNEKRQTVFCSDNLGDVSIAQMLLQKELFKNRTKNLHEDKTTGTPYSYPVPHKVVSQEKRKTVLYDKSIPRSIISKEKRKTVVYNNNANKIIDEEKRKTEKIVIDDRADKSSRVVHKRYKEIFYDGLSPIKIKSRESDINQSVNDSGSRLYSTKFSDNAKKSLPTSPTKKSIKKPVKTKTSPIKSSLNHGKGSPIKDNDVQTKKCSPVNNFKNKKDEQVKVTVNLLNVFKKESDEQAREKNGNEEKYNESNQRKSLLSHMMELSNTEHYGPRICSITETIPKQAFVVRRLETNNDVNDDGRDQIIIEEKKYEEKNNLISQPEKMLKLASHSNSDYVSDDVSMEESESEDKVPEMGNDIKKLQNLQNKSSQEIHLKFLNESRNKGAFDIKELPKRQTLNQFDNTHQLIDMLNEVTDQMEKNLQESSRKHSNSLKVYSDDYLDAIVNAESIDQRNNEIRNIQEVKDQTGNNMKKKQSKETKEKVTNKQLTIAYILNQSERIKSRSASTANSDELSLNDISDEIDFETEEITKNYLYCDQSKIINSDVKKILQFEDEACDNVFNDNLQHMNIVKKSHKGNEDNFKIVGNLTNAIPNLINDSQIDSLKSLMNDLVKPNANATLSATSKKNPSRQLNASYETVEPGPSSTNEFKLRKNRIPKKARIVDDAISIPLDPVRKGKSPNKTFDVRNPLNNIDLHSACNIIKEIEEYSNHQKKSKEIDRKFDPSNPLNNICLNVLQTAQHSIKLHTQSFIVEDVDSLLIENKHRNETGNFGKENDEISMLKTSDGVLSETSCVTLVDSSTDSNEQSLDNLETMNEKAIKSTDLNLSNGNMDVMYVMTNHKNIDGETDVEVTHNNRKRFFSPKKDNPNNFNTLESTPIPPLKQHKMSISPIAGDKTDKNIEISVYKSEIKVLSKTGMKETRTEDSIQKVAKNSPKVKDIFEASKGLVTMEKDKSNASYFDKNDTNITGKHSKQEKSVIKTLDDKVEIIPIEYSDNKFMTEICENGNDGSLNGPELTAMTDSGFILKIKEFEEKNTETCNTKKRPNLKQKRKLSDNMKADNLEDSKVGTTVNKSSNQHSKSTKIKYNISESELNTILKEYTECMQNVEERCKASKNSIENSKKTFEENHNDLSNHKDKTTLKELKKGQAERDELMESSLKCDEINSKNASQDQEHDCTDVSKDLSSLDLNDCRFTGEKTVDERKSKSRDSLGLIEELNSSLISDINRLSFMGTWRCVWESSAGDWSFLLLRGLVRLRLRLDCSKYSQVTAETPVMAIEVTPVLDDTTKPITRLCATSCALTIESMSSLEACPCAGRVPVLLTWCARAVIDASRWSRAMIHASTRLAFDIRDDNLSLEVANVPLRAIWHVSMRVVSAAEGPRARDVVVRPLCSARPLPRPHLPPQVIADVADGWDHVLETLWKVFRHLKHKSATDNLTI